MMILGLSSPRKRGIASGELDQMFNRGESPTRESDSDNQVSIEPGAVQSPYEA